MAILRQNKARLYKDFDLSFGKNAITGDLNKKIDANAVKQSMRTLVMTQMHERPFHPELSSDLFQQLFEQMTPFTAGSMARNLETLFDNYEKRVKIDNVLVEPLYDKNEYKVKIYFEVIGLNEPQELELQLERLR
jgi:phage baseplate assembly protein W